MEELIQDLISEHYADACIIIYDIFHIRYIYIKKILLNPDGRET